MKHERLLIVIVVKNRTEVGRIETDKILKSC